MLVQTSGQSWARARGWEVRERLEKLSCCCCRGRPCRSTWTSACGSASHKHIAPGCHSGDAAGTDALLLFQSRRRQSFYLGLLRSGKTKISKMLNVDRDCLGDTPTKAWKVFHSRCQQMQLLSKEEFEHFHLALETHNSICLFVICQYLHASLLVFVKTHRKCPGDDDDNDDDDDDDDGCSPFYHRPFYHRPFYH